MQDKTILAIDQGTTSSRAILFSAHGDIIGIAQKELPQIYPHKGWVEQDPQIIWQDTLAMCQEIFDTYPQAQNCVAIGITNQRETTIVWDRDTGKPLYNAIVWQDRRTADFCASLKPHSAMVAEKTGLRIDPYFSCSKIAWILDHVPNARQRATQGKLAFGTIDTFLLWHITHGGTQGSKECKEHTTDATNASRTGLFNIVTHDWDDDLLKLYDVPRSLLPDVKDNISLFGHAPAGLFGTHHTRDIPIGGMAGDQQAALIGQSCFQSGMMKSTYGTGCFALMHIGDQFRTSEHDLLTTIAYRVAGKTSYAIEGSIFTAGAAVQWLRDNMGFFAKASESEELAQSVPDNHGVYFVPAFNGLGAPYWLPEARATITGLTRDSTKAHITRAALEAQAYQTRDLLTAMEADTGLFPALLRVDGGLVENGFVCQFLSDLLGIPVERPAIAEATAWGAACLAGLQCGLYADFDDLPSHTRTAYHPAMDDMQRDALYAGWTDAIQTLLPSKP
jgi:glycerol kinase